MQRHIPSMAPARGLSIVDLLDEQDNAFSDPSEQNSPGVKPRDIGARNGGKPPPPAGQARFLHVESMPQGLRGVLHQNSKGVCKLVCNPVLG